MSGRDYQKKDPLYGAAILRVSLEMKGLDLRQFGGIVKDTIKKLGLSEDELTRYIKKNRKMLEQTCRDQGLAP